MIEITQIHPGTIAQDLGLLAGDKVVRINDHQINDQIDFRYYAAEETIELLIQRGAEQFICEIEKEIHEDIGVELEEMQMKSCGNACVFCFVFQNPKGMRKAMYFKDEDFRFSFLYGHYVTLTTVSDAELQRIVDQQLSPLYVSVHATEPQTRRLLLGIKHEDNLLEKIEFLVKGGIELHAQIVLCPGINDGPVFDRTVEDLQRFYPGVRSIAVVPVGLTRHRKNLYRLRIHTREELLDMIRYTDEIRRQKKQELGEWFVYLADEFFIKAGSELPEHDYYDQFYQIENGVGEFRDMIDKFDAAFPGSPAGLPHPLHLTWVTGTLAAENLEKYILTKLRSVRNLEIDLVPVTNNFYGEDITISGLLVGEDILRRLKGTKHGDLVLLPPRVLNHDGLFLDSLKPEDLEKSLGVPCIVYDQPIANLLKFLGGFRA
jgi:putative radical SAM enzyme (TIGR03279 family)